MNKRSFQVTLAILSLLPLLNGVLGLVMGPQMLLEGAASSVNLDSQFRYLCGIYFGLGLAILYTLRRIEEHKVLVRLLVLMVFIGGVGRLVSMLTAGSPHIGMRAGVALELLSPLLILWHNTLRKD